MPGAKFSTWLFTIAGNVAANAVDANTGSRWESVHGTDPQWLTVDLGATRRVTRVRLRWENAASSDYDVQIAEAKLVDDVIKATLEHQNGPPGLSSPDIPPSGMRTRTGPRIRLSSFDSLASRV